MADRQVDPPVPAKRKKKSKKKKGAKVELGAVTNGEMENTPKVCCARIYGCWEQGGILVDLSVTSYRVLPQRARW